MAFNKRAQLEMEARCADLDGLRVRTLNALALAIVNGTDGFRRSPLVGQRVTTIGEREVRDVLRRLVDVPRRVNTDPLAAWIEALAACRLGLRDPAAQPDTRVLRDLPPLSRAHAVRLGDGALRYAESIEPQADGSVQVEATMDVENVARAVVHMASLPAEANVQFMTVMATKMPFVGRG